MGIGVGRGDDVAAAEAEREELGFEDGAAVVFGEGPGGGVIGEGGWGGAGAGVIGEAVCAGGDVGDDFRTGEVEG